MRRRDLRGFAERSLAKRRKVVDREAPNNCIGPEVGSEDALTVFFAALNNALQKLLGRPLTSEDRIFHFDPERNRASLELPNLRPPQQLSCAVEMDAEDVQFSDLTRSEQVTLRRSVEHKISKLMLKELESDGFLVFDPTKPPLHAWVPGKGHGGRSSVALIPRALRRIKTVPPRVTRASTGPKTGEPVVMRLRKLQDTFAANPPDEYKEQIIFRQASDPWYATVVLRGSVTGGQRLEGAALGQSAQEAREAALRTLLDQLPRSCFPPTETPTRPQTAEAKGKVSRFVRPWSQKPLEPGRIEVTGAKASGRKTHEAHSEEARKTPPPPPKPKRMQPRMVS